MKNKNTICAGNYWWNYPSRWISNTHKNGKFFRGLIREFSDSKEYEYIDTGFRLCKENSSEK